MRRQTARGRDGAMGPSKYGTMGPPRSTANVRDPTNDRRAKLPRENVARAEHAHQLARARAATEWKELDDRRAVDVGRPGGAGALTRDQLPAALAVASTLHAKGRHVEAETVLTRIMRVCPGDATARRLMARITDAMNAPLRERNRRVDIEARGHLPVPNDGGPPGHDRGGNGDGKLSVRRVNGVGNGVSGSSLVEQPLVGGDGPPPPRRGRAAATAAGVTRVTKADLDAELAAKHARLAAERQAEREEAAALAARAAAEARADEDKARQRKLDAIREQKAALDQKRLWDQERFREEWAFEKGGPRGGTSAGGEGSSADRKTTKGKISSTRR